MFRIFHSHQFAPPVQKLPCFTEQEIPKFIEQLNIIVYSKMILKKYQQQTRKQTQLKKKIKVATFVFSLNLARSCQSKNRQNCSIKQLLQFSIFSQHIKWNFIKKKLESTKIFKFSMLFIIKLEKSKIAIFFLYKK